MRYVLSNDTGDLQTWCAVRVYVRRADNSTVELTSGYNTNVTRTVDGEGLQNVTFTPPNTVLYIGSDAVMVNAYHRAGAGAWTHKAVFITARLETTQIQNSTWIFRLYTSRNYASGSTANSLVWGSSSYLSRVEGVQVETLKPWEKQLHYMRNLDFIQFLLTPWTYYIGNLIYGIGLLFVVVTTYLRYEDYKPLIPWLWLFGGAGGALTLLLPVTGLHLSWFILALALGSTLYSLFR